MTSFTKSLAVVLTLLGLLVTPQAIGQERDATPTEAHRYSPSVDTTTYIRNPGMGWQLYAEEFQKPLADAQWFWDQVDTYAWAATTLYLRVPWSRMEPTEGNYAWEVDDNYKALVAGAKQRGIRLAFRVIVDSQDVHMQATPQYVFDAGATGYPAPSNSAHTTPYVTDPVFRAKFNAFLAAFGAQYNDPATVDYIDANGLGWWGEMSHVNNSQTLEVLEWVTGQYAAAFPDVLLAMNYPSGFPRWAQDLMIEKYDLAIRRDGLGSVQWMDENEKQLIASKFASGVTVLGENCYQNMETRVTACDSGFHNPSTEAMLQRVVDDAKKIRANTLDLRWPEDDVPLWLDKHRAIWNDFAVNGGYRLSAREITAPTSLAWGEPLTVQHSWTNGGVGRLPNGTTGWHDKYRVAFALLEPSTGAVVSHFVDSSINPGDWVKGEVYTSDLTGDLSGVAAGTYDLAYAIVDTRAGDTPEIALATHDARHANGWYVLGPLTVRPEASTPTEPVASPSASPTPSPTTSKPTAPPSTPPSAPPFQRTTPYTVPGTHQLNGRLWNTTCEAYSRTERCRTDIWASVVRVDDGQFEVTNGWAFNNLTYLPFMARGEWRGNPLAAAGSWTTADGRQWRTDCDSAATGRNGCRSYLLVTTYAAHRAGDGSYRFTQQDTWKLNNIVMFAAA